MFVGRLKEDVRDPGTDNKVCLELRKVGKIGPTFTLTEGICERFAGGENAHLIRKADLRSMESKRKSN